MKNPLLPLAFTVLCTATSYAGLINPTKAEVKAFNKADTDHDEVISPAEFSARLKTLVKAKKAGSPNVAELQAVADAFFDAFDDDNDGGIDLFEWFTTRSFDSQGTGLPDVMSLPGLDLNGDGYVKAAEFVKILKDILPAKSVIAWYKYILAISAE